MKVRIYKDMRWPRWWQLMTIGKRGGRYNHGFKRSWKQVEKWMLELMK